MSNKNKLLLYSAGIGAAIGLVTGVIGLIPIVNLLLCLFCCVYFFVGGIVAYILLKNDPPKDQGEGAMWGAIIGAVNGVAYAIVSGIIGIVGNLLGLSAATALSQFDQFDQGELAVSAGASVVGGIVGIIFAIIFALVIFTISGAIGGLLVAGKSNRPAVAPSNTKAAKEETPAEKKE
jgi:hypothetical protein